MSINEFYHGRKVMVTGAYGFVGTHLCRRLRQLGAIVTRIGRGESMYLTTEGKDLVFHLAAETEVGASFSAPEETYGTNFGMTLRVLEECRNHETPLVFASTDKVYGDTGEICREDQPLLHNADVYAASKKAADELCQVYSRVYGLPVTILRPCNIYGPGQRNETTLITGTILRLLRGEKAVIHANAGHCIREFRYVDDVVDAYLRVGADTGGLQIYNLGYHGGGFGPRHIVTRICDLMGKPDSWEEKQNFAGLQIGKQLLDSSTFYSTYPDFDGLGLTEGLEKTIQWYRENYS